MYLSLIIPVFNEERNINKNINKYHNYLKAQNYSSEIIIVNDGSSDKSKKIIEKIAEEKKNITIINLKENYGKGYAVKQGMAQAQGKFHLFLDADNSTSVDHLEKALPKILNNSDIVIGSRNSQDVHNTQLVIKQPFWKIILGRSGNILIRFLFKIKIRDTQCGFKIFSQKVSQKIFPKLKINRWLFDLEILILAQKYNFNIGIIPVKWVDSKDSKVKLKGYLISLIELFKIKYNLISKKYE